MKNIGFVAGVLGVSALVFVSGCGQKPAAKATEPVAKPAVAAPAQKPATTVVTETKKAVEPKKTVVAAPAKVEAPAAPVVEAPKADAPVAPETK